MGDPPPSMHVIAFSDLDRFLGRLPCSSGDVTRRCTTLMSEFHSNCDYRLLCEGLDALCRMELPAVPHSFGKGQSCTKKGCHTSFIRSVC